MSTRLESLPLLHAWPVKAGLAESPHWIAATATLVWVDIVRPSVNILDPDTGENRETLVVAKIGSASATASGGLLAALERELWLGDAAAELRRFKVPAMDGTHFNDGKCDPAGRFWVGSRSSDGTLGKGSLYRLDAAGDLRVMASGFDVCNGLGWSPNGATFYLVDTVPRLLYRYDFDVASGELSNRSIVQDFAGIPGKPDGLAIDAEGRIWCAMWDGAGIAILASNGEQLGWLETPCPRPTSCAFGGDEGRTLFITTAAHGLSVDDRAFGASGSILAFLAPDAGAPVASYGAPVPTRHWGR